GAFRSARDPPIPESSVYMTPKIKKPSSVCRDCFSARGEYSRWLTCGFEILKNNHGSVRPKNVLKLKNPFPGALNAPGCSVLNLLKNEPKPPRWLMTKTTTNVALIIMMIACRESVHATDRSPATMAKTIAKIE